MQTTLFIDRNYDTCLFVSHADNANDITDDSDLGLYKTRKVMPGV